MFPLHVLSSSPYIDVSASVVGPPLICDSWCLGSPRFTAVLLSLPGNAASFGILDPLLPVIAPPLLDAESWLGDALGSYVAPPPSVSLQLLLPRPGIEPLCIVLFLFASLDSFLATLSRSTIVLPAPPLTWYCQR
jgi:hypothetical protein